MLVGCEGRSQTGVRHVAYHREGAIAHEVRNVAAVADMDLVVCLGHSRARVGRILQFDNAGGDAVDEQKNVGDTHLVHAAVRDFKLVYHPESIVFQAVEVDVLHQDILVRVETAESVTVTV